MNVGDRVKLVSNIGVYPAGCKGIVSYVSGDGYINARLDEDEKGNAISPSVPLPPTPKSKFQILS